MSKTFTYVLIVIGVYVAIITGKTITGNKKTEEKKTGKSDDVGNSHSENKDEKRVSQGASNHMKYRIGARSPK